MFLRSFHAALTGVLVLAAFVNLGCSDLPELTANSCGNYVIDLGEDCDSHAAAPHTCASVGEEHACHFTCLTTDSVCPDGFGCGVDGACRRSSGEFVPSGSEGFVWPTSIHKGDFDGDQQSDLLLLGSPDSVGRRPARALYSQGFSLRTGLTVLPPEIANPAIGAGIGDGAQRDIAFADLEGVALLRGYLDRSADFSVFPTTTLPPGTHARIALTDAVTTRAADELVSLIERDNGSSEIVGIEQGSPPAYLVTAPGGEDELVAQRSFVLGHFDESLSCSQLALAYRDAPAVEVFSPCKDTGSGVTWNSNGSFVSIVLEPAAKLDQGILIVDIDVDGHLDMVIGAAGQTYATLGRGDGQFESKHQDGKANVAIPYELPDDIGMTSGFPLAMADLNADARMDFVVAEGIAISDAAGHHWAVQNIGVPWTDAVIAQFNANSFADVAAIAEGAVDVHFFNNAGNDLFGAATLSTQGFPRNLAVGDFDGDLLNDLAFAEAISEEGEVEDHLAFAFGSPFGPPTAPSATGEAGLIGQIVVGNLVSQMGLDPMNEVGLVVEAHEGVEQDAIAILPGRASRAIFSTLPLRDGPVPFLPVSLAFGYFGDETPDIVALGAHAQSGQLRMFRIEAFDQEGISVPPPSEPLSSLFRPAESSAINLRHGAIVAPIDLDGDEIDEAVAVANYGPSGQAALVVARYDMATSTFDLEPEQAFAAQISIDSTLIVEDFDGDGDKDIALTTGSLDIPGDLMVIWSSGTGSLTLDASTLQTIRLQDEGIVAAAAIQSPRGRGKLLLVSTLQSTHLLEFNSAHSFVDTIVEPIGPARAYGIIDFDRDGVEDIAAQSGDGLLMFRSIPQ